MDVVRGKIARAHNTSVGSKLKYLGAGALVGMGLGHRYMLHILHN